jgi:hypothetical protein
MVVLKDIRRSATDAGTRKETGTKTERDQFGIVNLVT